MVYEYECVYLFTCNAMARDGFDTSLDQTLLHCAQSDFMRFMRFRNLSKKVSRLIENKVRIEKKKNLEKQKSWEKIKKRL